MFTPEQKEIFSGLVNNFNIRIKNFQIEETPWNPKFADPEDIEDGLVDELRACGDVFVDRTEMEEQAKRNTYFSSFFKRMLKNGATKANIGFSLYSTLYKGNFSPEGDISNVTIMSFSPKDGIEKDITFSSKIPCNILPEKCTDEEFKESLIKVLNPFLEEGHKLEMNEQEKMTM